MSVWVIFIVAFLVFAFVIAAMVFWRERKWKRFYPEEENYIRSHWVRVIDSFHAYPAQAVMDADKILDYALSRKGVNGSLGEKLKRAGHHFSDENGIWKAHKFRNRLAHELMSPRLDEAKYALAEYKRALNDLGANL
ncbi:MAG: hypothetical protein WC873_03780 [Candidatus Gracilibacteria bacterium]